MSQTTAATSNPEQLRSLLDNGKWPTIPQFAASGILPDRAIRRLVADGTIQAVKIGNRHYLNPSALTRFLAGERFEGEE